MTNSPSAGEKSGIGRDSDSWLLGNGENNSPQQLPAVEREDPHEFQRSTCDVCCFLRPIFLTECLRQRTFQSKPQTRNRKRQCCHAVGGLCDACLIHASILRLFFQQKLAKMQEQHELDQQQHELDSRRSAQSSMVTMH